MAENGSTDKLRADQLKREYEERELADHATDEESAHEHERRADKAGYLREKLQERADSERKADSEHETPSEGEADDTEHVGPEREADSERNPD